MSIPVIAGSTVLAVHVLVKEYPCGFSKCKICKHLLNYNNHCTPRADFWPGSDKFESWKFFTHLTKL